MLGWENISFFFKDYNFPILYNLSNCLISKILKLMNFNILYYNFENHLKDIDLFFNKQNYLVRIVKLIIIFIKKYIFFLNSFINYFYYFKLSLKNQCYFILGIIKEIILKSVLWYWHIYPYHATKGDLYLFFIKTITLVWIIHHKSNY